MSAPIERAPSSAAAGAAADAAAGIGTYALRFRSRSFDGGSSPDTPPSLYSTLHDSDAADSTSASSVDEAAHRPLVPGVYAPTLAFFERDTEELDLTTTAKHAVRLARAGVAGLATQGSNGEAVHLTHVERRSVTRATRRALTSAGFSDMPIIVGCGAQSTRETIELCRDAYDAGGDYALVLPPAYYRSTLRDGSLVEFFTGVADSSPVPILVYNYPAAVSGLDLDSDVIIELSKHPNIVGCKLTCGNTGKLNRIAAATAPALAGGPHEPASGFMCFGGSADFILQTMTGGGSGVIAGLANVAPRACSEVVNLYAAGKIKKARRLQSVVARGDWVAIKRGIVGTKSVLETYFGYGGYGRKPLPRPSEAEAKQAAEEMKELVALEMTLC